MTDLASDGFGIPWGHTRSFGGGLGYDFDVGQGFNWQIAECPQLLAQLDEAVFVIGQAQVGVGFDWNGDNTWTPRYGQPCSLVLDLRDYVYRLTDNHGNLAEFDAYTRQFLRRFDAAGNVTQVVSRFGYTELGPIFETGPFSIV